MEVTQQTPSPYHERRAATPHALAATPHAPHARRFRCLARPRLQPHCLDMNLYVEEETEDEGPNG